MTKETAIKLFNEKHIRTQWDDVREKWYFSIVDVVAVLTESENANNYWKVLKNRLKKEGSQLVTNCNQLKMQSSDSPYSLFAIWLCSTCKVDAMRYAVWEEFSGHQLSLS